MPGIPQSYSFLDPSEKETPRSPTLQRWGILVFCVLLLGAFSFQYFSLKNPIISLDKSLVSVKGIHPDFVGRESYLKALHKTLLSNPTTRLPTALLWGEGGVGKSEIAITFANMHQKQFSFIYWIDSATEDKYYNSYCGLAELLDIALDKKDKIEELRQKVHSRLETGKWSKPWLLIFDNVEVPLELPQRGKGAALLTSRNQLFNEGHCYLEVSSFSEKEAHALIAKITQQNKTDDWQQLIRELDYFPLILSLATHYITTTPEMTVEKYLSLLNTDHTAVLENSSINARYPSHLLASWKISTNALKNQYLEAFEWLQFCSYLHPDAIPVDWIAKWLKFREFKGNIEWKTQEILRAVTHQSFMRYNEKTHTLSLHRLKQEALRKNENLQGDSGKQALHFLVRQIQAFNSYDDLEWRPESWEDWRKWGPHAEWFISHFKEQFLSTDLAKIYQGLGNYFTIIFDSADKAFLFYEEALRLNYEYLETKTHPDIAWTLCNFAWCLTLKRDYEKAFTYTEKALDICKNLYGDSPHPLVLAIKISQGHIKHWQYASKKSLVFFEEALKIQEQLYGSTLHPSLSECLKWVGFCWIDLGNYKNALRYLEKALAINVQIYGDRYNAQRGYIFNSLAATLRLMGNLPKAAQYLEESLNESKKLYKNNNCFQKAVCLEELGNIYHASGNYKKALLFHEKSLKMIDELFFNNQNSNKTYFTIVYMRLGSDWEGLGNNQKALEYYSKALEIRKKAFKNKAEPFTARAARKLGKIWCRLGNIEKGIQFLEEALKISQELAGSDPHPMVIKNLETLAIAYQATCPQKANDYLVEAKKISDQLKALQNEG